MKIPPFLGAVALASVLTLTAQTSHAALLVYEGFNYAPVSGIATGTYNGGLGFFGAWNSAGNALTASAKFVSGSLTPAAPATLVTTGNSFLNNNGGDNGGGTSFMERNFTTAVSGVANTTIWHSFVVSPTNNVNTNKNMFVLRSGGTNILVMGDVGDNVPGNPANLGFNWNAGLFQDTGITMPTSPTLILAKISQGATTFSTNISMWVNPSNVSSEAALLTPNASLLGQANFSLTNVQLTSRNGGLDEFRIGDTLADVTPVPEPTTVISGMAIALVGLATMFRRRSLNSKKHLLVRGG